MAIKIPKKLYVTYQQRTEGEPRLGFASPYEKNSAFEKRRQTQENWAYGRGVRFEIQDDEGVICAEGDASKQFMTRCYPEIIDNPPLEGFEISKTVTHGGGWNRTNTVWRIHDPRDFELEITSSNLAKVLAYATIQEGKILGKCCWGRAGADNVLLPENSEPYRDGLKITKRLENTIKLKDIKPGSKVTLINDKLKDTYVFVGQYHLLVIDEGFKTSMKRVDHKNLQSLKTVKKPIYMTNKGEFFSIGSKIKDVVGEYGEFDSSNMLDQLYETINMPGRIDGLPAWILAISENPIKTNEIKVGLEDTQKSHSVQMNSMSARHDYKWDRNRNFVCKGPGGQDLIFSDQHYKDRRFGSNGPLLFNFYSIDLNRLLNGEFSGIEGSYHSFKDLSEVSDPKVVTYTYQNRTVKLDHFPMWLLNKEYE